MHCCHAGFGVRIELGMAEMVAKWVGVRDGEARLTNHKLMTLQKL